MQQENPENPPLRSFGYQRLGLLIAASMVALLAILFAPRPIMRDRRDPAPIARAQEGLEKHTFTLTRQDGRVLPFTLEIAATERQQEIGLMFRTQLAENEGMLFPYPDDAPRMMWMKNTLIPLDMLFFDGEGRLVSVITRAQPESETILESVAPARQVLELRAGTVEAYGLAVGDRLRETSAAPGSVPAEAQPKTH